MVELIQTQVQNKLTDLATDRATSDYLQSSLKGDSYSADDAMWSKGRHSDEVAVLLSGGVDSSVALKLLQEQGHKVISNESINGQ
jgi:asparagine synthetase B (glutamine-hydrolysing)